MCDNFRHVFSDIVVRGLASELKVHLPPLLEEPIGIDIENDIGEYIEPNVWIIHSI